jgi:hypothetical protein
MTGFQASCIWSTDTWPAFVFTITGVTKTRYPGRQVPLYTVKMTAVQSCAEYVTAYHNVNLHLKCRRNQPCCVYTCNNYGTVNGQPSGEWPSLNTEDTNDDKDKKMENKMAPKISTLQAIEFAFCFQRLRKTSQFSRVVTNVLECYVFRILFTAIFWGHHYILENIYIIYNA